MCVGGHARASAIKITLREGFMTEPGELHTLSLCAPPCVPCPSCRFANPVGFRFCGACGGRLVASSDVQTPVRRPAAERRQLTVLFCDLVDSTRLANTLELEELRDVIRSYQAACAECVRRYGGTISRYMGDGILVLFGYPHAHEDDAERAVRAGLAMVDAVARLPPPVAVTEPLAVRVGIASGVVVAGDLIGNGSAEEEAVLGETVNLAGRLHAAGLPGTVVVASRTRALLGGRFLCEDLGAHRLKGFGEPVPVWRAVRPRSIASHFTAVGDDRRASLVGREDDLTWLRGLWRSAADHRGRVATLAGEAGIGKSRVAEALRECLGDACMPLRLQCSPHYMNRALHPVIAHIELAAGIGPEDPAATKLDKLQTWLRPEIDRVEDLALLAVLLSIPADTAPLLAAMTAQRQKQDTFDLLLRMWQTQAAARPLLILVEDLHWADPTTMEFLSALVLHIDGMAALAICTFRPDFVAPWRAPQVEGRELRRLPREAALHLVENVAGAGRMPDAVLEQVVLRADGIPLFIEELTHAVLGSGVLRDSRRSNADAQGPVPDVAIPATLQGSLMARLDQLGPAKFVAQLASAIGREFSYALLSAIAPLPAEGLRAELAALEDSGLVYSGGATPGEVFAFKHALVQEVAYQTLLRGRRHELHLLIARRLQERFPQQARDTPELLAHHWTQAGDIERAVAGWLAAGERASERSEYNEAVGHLRKGLDLVADLPDPVQRRDRELALLLALGPVLMTVTGAGTPEVSRLYTRALELCGEIRKSGLHFAARWGRWRAAMDHRAGLERADDLLRLARELGDPALLVQAHHCQWATLYMLGAHEECCRHADEGIRLYDPERDRLHALLYGGHDPKVCALGERALSSLLLGRLDESVSSIRLALDWAESLAHVCSRVHALDYALAVHRLRRSTGEVARRADQMVGLATDQRLGEYRAKGLLYGGWAQALRGDVPGGLQEMRVALAWEEEAGTPEDFPLYYEMFAEVCGRAGRFDEGLDAVSKGFAQAERARIIYWNAELHRRRGELLLAAGADRGTVANCFEHALTDARAHGALVLELRAATSLARLRRAEGRSGASVAYLRAAYAGFSRDLDAPDLRDARAVLAATP
jgi:predicted ATPase/class 3 adenylate cyclase